MKKILQLLQKYTLRLLLLMIAIYSGFQTLDFGERIDTETGNSLYLNEDGEFQRSNSADNVAIDTGSDGGAIGFGFICSVSIFCFVWILKDKSDN
jgi:hypothetical protein